MGLRMADTASNVFFYYPPGVSQDFIPEVKGQFLVRKAGNYVWTVRTFGYLKDFGFPCQLTAEIPPEGIIVTHRDFLPDSLMPNSRQVFVCIVADMRRHPYAQLHIVQNPADSMIRAKHDLWPACCIPLWTESGLRPRNPARGSAFTNVAYFGLLPRLAPQLRGEGFAKLMAEHGFSFRIPDPDTWNDYSETDAVLAVRSFAAVPFYKHPPSKLYNSWIAGVPALLGRESAYEAERKSELDYFEVTSIEEILQTLERIRSKPDLRAAIAQNCAERAKEVSDEALARRWIVFFETMAQPAYQAWCAKSELDIRRFLRDRRLAYQWWVGSDFIYRGGIFARKQVMRLVR